LILALIACSYLAIFEATYLAAKVNTKSGNEQCGTYAVSFNTNPAVMNAADVNTITYQKVQFDHDWQYYNKTDYGSNGFVFCYCKELLYQYGSQPMLDYTFFNAVTGRHENWCRDLRETISFASYAEFFVAVVVVVINISIRLCIERFVDFEQFEDGTYEKLSFALKIFLGEYVNTGLLSLLIYGKLSKLGVYGASATDNSYFGLAIFAGDYSDFDFAWYSSVGVSTMFTMWLFTIGTQAWTVLKTLAASISRAWDKRAAGGCVATDRTVTHCDVQEELNELYEGPNFQFEVQYASVVNVIWVCRVSPVHYMMCVVLS
jgi:hypothetical protein